MQPLSPLRTADFTFKALASRPFHQSLFAVCRGVHFRQPEDISVANLPCASILPMKYRVVFEQDEDGVFIASCPSLPGCISQGRTRAEAQANISEAIRGYLRSLQKHGEPIPPGIEEEVVEIALG